MHNKKESYITSRFTCIYRLYRFRGCVWDAKISRSTGTQIVFRSAETGLQSKQDENMGAGESVAAGAHQIQDSLNALRPGGGGVGKKAISRLTALERLVAMSSNSATNSKVN